MRGQELQTTDRATPAEMERPDEGLLREAMRAITGRLGKEVDDRISLKREIEMRWIEDLRQYHGKYDDKTVKALSDQTKSRVFLNSTRPKTNTMAARLCDLLFPTDDKNWGIQPTPVPELGAEAEAAVERVKQALEQAEMAEAMEAAAPPADPNADPAAQGAPPPAVPSPRLMQARQEVIDAEEAAKNLRLTMEEAEKRADLMADEIDDHLKECRYHAEARAMIEDACKIGTGVIKGPVVDGKSKRKWKEITPEGGAPGAQVYEIEYAAEKRPSFQRVDPWHFFPDPGARTIEESDTNYQRHLMTDAMLRKLAKNPTFDKEAIRRLMQTGAKISPPQFITDLRTLTENSTNTGRNDFYHVYEYHGTLTGAEMMTLIMAKRKEDFLKDIPQDDPLVEIPVTIWFCDGEVLKFGLQPMESCEPIYSLFNLDKDEASVWGYGIPYLMRDSQRAMNGGWRMMLDNAGLSTGPQIVVNPDVIEPVDGDWSMKPRKLWRRKTGGQPGVPAFETYHIESHQAELANIIELAQRFIDTETGLPLIAQGEQGPQTTQTMGGMSILMNSSNVGFRRTVKNFDDDVTTPIIRRIYDWLMQFSTKDHIKGDYEVDAKGSSVLLVREMQAQNLMAIAIQLGGHPVFGPMLKGRDLLAEIFATHMLSPDKFVLSQEEIDRNAMSTQANPDQDPSIIIAREANELKASIAEMEWDGRKYVADKQLETAMTSLAVQGNTTLDKVEADMQTKKEDRDSKERMFAAEIAKTEEIGPSGGGNF